MDIKPFYDTCIKHLSSLQSYGHTTQAEHQATDTEEVHGSDTTSPHYRPTSVLDVQLRDTQNEEHISFSDVLSSFMQHEVGVTDAAVEETAAMCDVMAAYSTVCEQRSVIFSLPPICRESLMLSVQFMYLL